MSMAPSAKVLSISRLMALFSSGVAPSFRYSMRWKGVTKTASAITTAKPPKTRPHQGVRWMKSERGFMDSGIAAPPEDTRKGANGQ